MKYIICILISFTFSTLCLSQNELKVHVSYLKEKQFLLIKVKTPRSTVTAWSMVLPVGVHNFKCKGHLHGRTGGYAHD